MRVPTLLATGGAVLALTGCATLFGSKEKDLPITSTPPDAEVYLDGNRIGTTPVKFRINNVKEHTITLRKEGFKEASCVLNRGTDAGWVILDVLGTGLVGVVIDAATGNWSQVKAKECTLTLEPLSSAADSTTTNTR